LENKNNLAVVKPKMIEDMVWKSTVYIPRVFKNLCFVQFVKKFDFNIKNL